MTFDSVTGILGLIIGIVSFAYAIYQRHEVSRFKRYQTGQLRANLKDCIVVMSQSYRLVVDYDKVGITNPVALKRIAAIHTISASLMRSFFHELSEVDTPYNKEKLLSYANAGLITSKWVWLQAQTFIQSDEIIDMPELPDETKDWVPQSTTDQQVPKAS